MSDANKYMPPCVGQYEVDDATCDGDIKASDPEDRIHCLWRDYCLAFQLHLKETKKTVDDMVVIELHNLSGVEEHYAVAKQGVAEFMATLEKNIKRWGIRNGVATLDPIKAPKQATNKATSAKDGRRKRRNWAPYNRGRRRTIEALIAMAERNRAHVYGIYDHFLATLIESLPGHRFPRGKEACLPGRLFLRDRRARSLYVSIYVQTNTKAKPKPLAVIRFKPRRGFIDIGMPLRIAQFKGVDRDTIKRMNLIAREDGGFFSFATDQDKDGAEMVAQVIGRMVTNGILELPQPK